MKTIAFEGVEGNRIVADLYEPSAKSAHPPVLLVHGGGQTRHAWRGTARALANAGFTAIAMDQRGHGDSAWVESKAYAFYDFAADLATVCRDMERQSGRRPIVVGASLGGLASLLAEGRAGNDLLGGLVLVDVTPRMDPDGIRRIHGFMGERMSEGFATLEEAAAAISAYLPARRKPASLSGLAKNLRRGDDGRYRWHWDPAFMGGPRPVNFERASVEAELDSIVAKLKVPTLLVRGRQSELVTEEAVAEFLKAVPHARYVDVLGAGHMVAGDRNDAFTDAVIGFLLEETAVAS
ncbi:alpha/beta fold hydrolase [Georhizobium sp. MAB10]|uniref:alpha/beta fold hydrolase n=1 Tax=Georhizobium sp. MAB10 TaxID=3028319 RepID=UPI003855B3EF